MRQRPWWQYLAECRKRVEERLGQPLADEVWDWLCTCCYDRTPTDEADAEQLIAKMVKRVREAMTIAARQSRIAAAVPREPAPPFVPARRSTGDRQAALSRVLAALAARDEEVVRFRRDVLGGRLLARDEVARWVSEQAERDGPPTRWLTVPLPADVPPGAGEPLTLHVDTSYRVEAEALAYVVPGERWTRTKPVAADGVLGRLGQLSRWLSQRFGWPEAAATTFVLTGAAPLVSMATVTYRSRWPFSALGRIVLEVDPVLTPAEVAARYRQARARALGRRLVRPQSPKHLALAVFAAEHPDGTLRERMAAWNRRYPKWRYREVTNFGRDLRTALRRLLDSPAVEPLVSQPEEEQR